jgi:hypothetical protein
MKVEWKFEEKTYQIADTGDYNGHIEVSNSKGLVLISRKEYDDGDLKCLIDTMNRIGFIVDSTSHEEENYGLFLENKHLKRQSLQTEWVSVEDRLPENNVIVMVSCEHGVTMATLQKFENGNYLWWAVINIGTYEDSTNADYVTHWMPLPTPPNK